MLNGDSCVGGQTSVSNNTKHHWVAGCTQCRWGCKVELIAHPQFGVTTNVIVLGVGGQILQNHMVEKRRRVVENWVGICEVVCLQDSRQSEMQIWLHQHMQEAIYIA